ncbi:MAG: response regulator [Syntrophobacteraceae bacterium]
MQEEHSGKQPGIFLVDDDERIRRSLEFYFRRKKVPFFSFASAEEALEYFRNNRPELLLIDYRLPGLNGLELVRELNGFYPGCMKILITGYGNLDIAEEAMRLGVHDLIQKPFNTATIQSAVKALKGRAQQGLQGFWVDGKKVEESQEWGN